MLWRGCRRQLYGLYMCISGQSYGPECKNMTYGSDYHGTVSVTEIGSTCIPWTNHSYYVHGNNLPDATVADASNFCRNPDCDSRGPWCYTQHAWGYCTIPYCDGYVQSNVAWILIFANSNRSYRYDALIVVEVPPFRNHPCPLLHIPIYLFLLMYDDMQL